MNSAVAALWGLAEATFFFIVPDVWLSLVAIRRGARAGARAAAWTALAASFGGLGMFLWAATAPTDAGAALVVLPGIDADLIARTRGEFAREGVVALISGAFSGVPFKIYAVLAPALGMEATLFVLVAFPARLARFLLAVVIAAGLARWLSGRISPGGLIAVWGGFWLLFYGLYFIVMAG